MHTPFTPWSNNWMETLYSQLLSLIINIISSWWFLRDETVLYIQQQNKIVFDLFKLVIINKLQMNTRKFSVESVSRYCFVITLSYIDIEAMSVTIKRTFWTEQTITNSNRKINHRRIDLFLFLSPYPGQATRRRMRIKGWQLRKRRRRRDKGIG